MSEFKVNDQVLVRRPLRGGTVQIKMGTISAFSEDKAKAVVNFPVDNTRQTLPVSQLESVQARYKRANVQFNPLRRNIAFLSR